MAPGSTEAIGPVPLPPSEPGSLHALILQSLDDDQAQEIVSIPLEGKSSIADHMVIASGRSTRQVAAMAQKLAERIKQAGSVMSGSKVCRPPTGCWSMPATWWCTCSAPKCARSTTLNGCGPLAIRVPPDAA